MESLYYTPDEYKAYISEKIQTHPNALTLINKYHYSSDAYTEFCNYFAAMNLYPIHLRPFKDSSDQLFIVMSNGGIITLGNLYKFIGTGTYKRTIKNFTPIVKFIVDMIRVTCEDSVTNSSLSVMPLDILNAIIGMNNTIVDVISNIIKKYENINLIDNQDDKPTDKQDDKPTDKQDDKPTDKLTTEPIKEPDDKLIVTNLDSKEITAKLYACQQRRNAEIALIVKQIMERSAALDKPQ